MPPTPRPAPQWWSLSARVITPAFVGGAEPRRTDPDAPLRPSSIRGALRHWLRMGLGDVLGGGEGDEDRRRAALGGLRRIEAALFGTTEAGSRARVGPTQAGAPQTFAVDGTKQPGLAYLGYGLLPAKRSDPDPKGLMPGQSLALRVGLQPRPSDPPALRAAMQEALLATLWLWANLGGIGARTRRGWGALWLVADGPDEQLEAWFPADAPGSVAALLDHLDGGLVRALKALRGLAVALGVEVPPPRDRRPLPELRTLYGVGAFRVMPRTTDKASEALERVGGELHRFRSTLARKARGLPPHADFAAVKEALLSGKAPAQLPRAAFGLPLNFYFKSLDGRKPAVKPTAPRRLRYRGPAPDRVPSGLLIRVHRLASGQHAVVLLDLDERAPAPLGGCGVVLEEGRRQWPAPAPGRGLVAEFLDLATRTCSRRARCSPRRRSRRWTRGARRIGWLPSAGPSG